jgi:hypothetical protein
VRLSERPKLGFDGVSELPLSISVAKCDDDLHCSEFLVATGLCRGFTVRLCKHGLHLRDTSRQDRAMYVAAGIAESGDDITSDVKRWLVLIWLMS